MADNMNNPSEFEAGEFNSRRGPRGTLYEAALAVATTNSWQTDHPAMEFSYDKLRLNSCEFSYDGLA